MISPKVKACRICKATYLPAMPLQRVCGPACGIELARLSRTAKAETARRKAHRSRKEACRPLSWYRKRAQLQFNRFIRLRDRDSEGNPLPCISCQRSTGAQRHAGHFKSVGGNSAILRFNQDNCHSQCAHCNNHKSGALSEYRKHLIDKIGLARVEALEADHKPYQYRKEELKEIRDKYKALADDLERNI